jgi:hypothetical protein
MQSENQDTIFTNTDITSEMFQTHSYEFSTLESGLKGRLLYDKKDLRAKINKMSIGRSNILGI